MLCKYVKQSKVNSYILEQMQYAHLIGYCSLKKFLILQ